MNMLADLGGWSDSATGQALASVGYNWTQNIATTVGYRVMYNYTHQDTGYSVLTFEPKSFRYQQWMYGPFLGFNIAFSPNASPPLERARLRFKNAARRAGVVKFIL